MLKSVSLHAIGYTNCSLCLRYLPLFLSLINFSVNPFEIYMCVATIYNKAGLASIFSKISELLPFEIQQELSIEANYPNSYLLFEVSITGLPFIYDLPIWVN